MTKSLMVYSRGSSALASGDEINLFGGRGQPSVEANTQYAATQDATFSKLGFNIITGGSGTNNAQFRDAGANGNQLATVAGANPAEDAVNTDALSAGDLFNLALTDNGTTPEFAWVKANVEFATGHGAFHGSADFNGVILDAESSTRFIAINGDIAADGSATEANVAMRNRAYDTWAAMQVRAAANARTNDSVFKNRTAAGTDGTGAITFGAGVSGLLQDTAIGDAIADGAAICVSVTLGTGVENLDCRFVGATLTSSTQECDCCIAIQAGIARAASATAHYLPLGGYIESLTALTEAQARVKPGFAFTARNPRCYLSANTYTVDGTLKLMQNGSAVKTVTITAGGGAAWYELAESVTGDDNDELSFEIDEGTSGSITIHQVMITLRDDTTSIPLFMHHYKQMWAA